MTRIAAFLTALMLLTAPAAKAEPATFDLDPSHTTVAFWVDHIGYARTLGWFTETSGSFTYDASARTVSDIRVEITADSVFTNDARRDGHVKNPDFLNAKAHPVITFTAASGMVTGDNTGVVTGDLTILGQTRPVEVAVTLNKDGPYPFGHKKRTIGVSASAVIQRSAFGMTYGLPGIVGDEVTVQIELEAIIRD